MSVAPGNVCCVCLFVFACVLCSYFLLLGNAMHLQQLSKGFSIYWRHVLSYFGPSQSLSFKTHFCTEFNLVYFNPDMVSCPYLLSLSTIVSFITYTCHLCSLSPASLASNQPHHIHLFPVYISTSLPHLLCAMLYSVLLVFWLYVVFFGFVAFYFFLWVLGQALSIFYFFCFLFLFKMKLKLSFCSVCSVSFPVSWDMWQTNNWWSENCKLSSYFE